MWRDLIVEEIHRYRQGYAARFHYDLDAMCDDIESRQGKDDTTIRIRRYIIAAVVGFRE